MSELIPDFDTYITHTEAVELDPDAFRVAIEFMQQELERMMIEGDPARARRVMADAIFGRRIIPQIEIPEWDDRATWRLRYAYDYQPPVGWLYWGIVP